MKSTFDLQYQEKVLHYPQTSGVIETAVIGGARGYHGNVYHSCESRWLQSDGSALQRCLPQGDPINYYDSRGSKHCTMLLTALTLHMLHYCIWNPIYIYTRHKLQFIANMYSIHGYIQVFDFIWDV